MSSSVSSSGNEVVDEMRCLECVTSSAVGTTLVTNVAADCDTLGLEGMGSVDLSDCSSGLRIVNVDENSCVRHEWMSLERLEMENK